MVNEGHSWSGFERNRCFLNTGQPRFANVSATSGLDFIDDARAIGVVDWDADGDLDLLQVNRTAPQLRLLRNDWTSDHQWLQLRLVGTQCNRDAIGSRVELVRRGVTKKDIRTVRAGNSFLSQSTKWIHFGLAEQTDIQEVIVRWPGGLTESFRGLEPNQRYELHQGTGRAKLVPPRQGVARLAASPPQLPTPSEQARVMLAARVPLPALEYLSFSGQPVRLSSGQPTLVQFWASWCPKCQAELREFADRAAEVRAAGVRLVALSVDGLSDGQTDANDARKAISQWGSPGETALASRQLLEKLEVLRGELFSNSKPFPVPASLLLDEKGQLTVLYVGPVSVDQLLQDAKRLDLSDEEQRELAIPAKGRWFTAPRPVLLAELAAAFRSSGFTEDADEYARKALPQQAVRLCALGLELEKRGNVIEALRQYRAAVQLDPQSGRAWMYLGKCQLRQSDVAAAIASFETAIGAEPDLAEAHFHLGTAYVLSKRPAEAKVTFLAALGLKSDFAAARTALGRLYMQEGKADEALTELRRAVESDAKFLPAHIYLGAVLAEQKNFDQATTVFQTAIRLAPYSTEARESLAKILVLEGQYAEAVNQYRQVIKMNPKSGSAAMQLAWLLATAPDPKVRSGAEAVRLAEALASASQFRSAAVLDVLAAAHAEAGNFSKAQEMVRRAISLPEAKSRPGFGDSLRRRLKLYESGTAFRQKNGLSPGRNDGIE
jgi:tetratricopeptide (TPR) repeat protein/peroxiredoxin